MPPITGVGIDANSNEFAVRRRARRQAARAPTRSTPQPHPATTITHDARRRRRSPTSPDDVDRHDLRRLQTSTPGAQRPELTLLTLRDSTGNALSPLWSWSFGTTVQYGHGIGQVGVKPPDLAQLMATLPPRRGAVRHHRAVPGRSPPK